MPLTPLSAWTLDVASDPNHTAADDPLLQLDWTAELAGHHAAAAVLHVLMRQRHAR